MDGDNIKQLHKQLNNLNDRIEQLHELVNTKLRRLHVLEIQKARQGSSCPPEIELEIQDTTKELEKHEKQIEELVQQRIQVQGQIEAASIAPQREPPPHQPPPRSPGKPKLPKPGLRVLLVVMLLCIIGYFVNPLSTKNTITFAFEAFPTYYPGIVMEVRGLLKQRGYELKLVPIDRSKELEFNENARWEKIKSGEWDVMAVTLNSFALKADPSIGAITAVIDESAGADKLVGKPDILTINDLKGKRIAFSKGSVSEYFLYYALNLAGLRPQDVKLEPRDDVEAAVAAYTAGQADAVSAWEPDVLAAQQKGGKVLIESDELRQILDVLVTSRVAMNNKPEAVQAFHDAWFEALKITIDTPNQAGQAIVEWGYSEWTFIEQPGDLRVSLQNLAQATLGANQIAFQSPQLLVSRIEEAQKVWAWAGQSLPSADLSQVIDGRFVLKSASNPQYFSSLTPISKVFMLPQQIDLPPLSPVEQQTAQPIVVLALKKVDFRPESADLTPTAIVDLTNQVLPVLRSSQLYLKIEGSAAWPGPPANFSEEEIREFAERRANSVKAFLIERGIDEERLLVGTIPPKYPRSVIESELIQDRIVQFTILGR